jgi:Domain of unknown function (DUF4214)/Lectin C-type domain
MRLSSYPRASTGRRRIAFTLGAFLTVAGVPVAGAQALAGDQVADAGAVVALASTLPSAVASQDPVQLYIQRVYADLFNREPDPSGLATWTSALTGGTPRVAVANAITYSTEYRMGLITGSYQHYLGRGPDPSGMNNWLAAMGSGLTVSQLESGFIASVEYYAKAGSTDDVWVTKLYADVLGRTSGPAEVASWTGQLAGGASRTQVAMGFLLSTEHLNTIVTGYYQDLLGRGLDPSGRSTWVSILQAGGRNETIIGGIIASAEYWTMVITDAKSWCTPYTPAKAQAQVAYLRSYLLPIIALAAGNGAMSVYNDFLFGGVATDARVLVNDPTTVFAFRSAPETWTEVDRILTEKEKLLPAQLPGQNTTMASIDENPDFAYAISPWLMVDGTGAPGLMAGGSWSGVTINGRHFDDDRHFTGTLTLLAAQPTSKGVITSVKMQADLNLQVMDSIDFCDGNPGNALAQQFTVPLSRLEVTPLDPLAPESFYGKKTLFEVDVPLGISGDPRLTKDVTQYYDNDPDDDGAPDSQPWTGATFTLDNCPGFKNPDQTDSDHDDVGNACSGWEFNDHWYKWTDSPLLWTSARDYCAQRGGHLVTITSAEEQASVTSHNGNGWLGGTDEGSEGTWRWVTGEPFTYTNWQPGQPGGGIEENFLFARQDVDGPEGAWDDQRDWIGPNGEPHRPLVYTFTCEYE